MKGKLIVNPVSGTDAAPDALTAINDLIALEDEIERLGRTGVDGILWPPEDRYFVRIFSKAERQEPARNRIIFSWFAGS